MADDTIKIAIEAVDNASKTLAAAGDSVDKLGKKAEESSKGIINVNDALAKLIQQERVSKVMDDARGAMEHLTEAEKDQIVAAHELEEAQKDAGRGAEEGAKGFESFAGQLVAVQAGVSIAQEAIGGLKQVWDFGKQGAENQRIAESFNRTAKSIGADADDIVKKLDEAARGTVDDEELMQASTRALTLGVAKNGDDLVKVMKLARAAALQFGGDAGSAFETINQAIGNLAPRALKQFGIIVSLKDANDAYAKSLGVTADSLTEEQQRQALLNAVLEQGTKTFKDIGDSATTTGEKMKAVETRIANLVDIAKELAATGISTAFTITDAPKNAMEAFIGTAQKMKTEVIAGRLSVKDYNDGLRGMASAISGVVGGALADAALKDNLLNDSFEKSTKGAYGLGGALDESARAARKEADAAAQAAAEHEKLAKAQGAAQFGAYGVNGALDESERALRKTKEAAQDAADSLAKTTGIMSDLKVAMGGALQKELDNFNKKQDDLSAKAAKIRDELTKLESSQGRAVTSTRKQTLSTAELNLAQLKLKDTQEQLSKSTDPLKQAELAVKVEDLTAKINGASGAVTSYIDNSKRISELQGQYDEINKEISANAAAHEDATRRILFGYAEQQLAVGGLTETEAKALDALAVRWGLKSKEDIAAMQAIRDAAAGLAKDGSINEFVGTIDRAAGQSSTIFDGVAQDIGSVTQAHDTLVKAFGIPLTPPAPVDLTVTTKDAHAAIQGVLGDVEKAKDKIAAPIPLNIDKNAAENSIKDLLRIQPVSTPRVDTTQAVKDIQSFTTDKVGVIPKEKTTTIKADTVTATKNTNDILKLFGTIPPKTETTVDVDAKLALQTLDDVIKTLASIFDKTVEVKVKYNQVGTPPEGFQSGGSYTVPPNPAGGTGDYFPVVAAPGERVTVETRSQQQKQQAQGDTYNYTTNVYNPLAAAMLADKQRRERLARSNSRMGVTQ